MMIQQINLLLAVLLTTVVIVYLTWSSQGKEIRRFVSAPPVTAQTCYVSLNESQRSPGWVEPVIYFITPSYPRREQVAELTRLGQTLMHVPGLHWIVADDNSVCNPMITQLLPRFGMPFTHIASPMPEMYRSVNVIPRGVANRRAALDWIRAHVTQGVLYFGDDDNTFDLRLFEEIRDTKKVSMFPVGLIGDYSVSAPIVKEGKVVGFYDSWPAKRKFPVDMAGFAINVEYLLKYPEATMPFRAGYEEDRFLRSLGVTLDMIEPKAQGCTQVLVWHTQTNKKPAPTLKIESNPDSSLQALLQQVNYMGMAHVTDNNGEVENFDDVTLLIFWCFLATSLLVGVVVFNRTKQYHYDLVKLFPGVTSSHSQRFSVERSQDIHEQGWQSDGSVSASPSLNVQSLI